MEIVRSSGILLHPTSLPGPHGIGDLGDAAYQFVDYLVEAKQTLWQVLPLGPTGYGDSPYASFSTFAGNPLLINLNKLVDQGDLTPEDIADVPDFPADRVDYGWAIYWKIPLLEKAAKNFLTKADAARKVDFDAFCAEQAVWLDDYALFMAVKEHFDAKAKEEEVFGAMWSNYWDKDIALRQPAAIERWREKEADTIAIHKVLQYYFFQQWGQLRQYANDHGIKIIGDIPIFVAPDSVDVWANPSKFFLDDQGQPTVVAGVPPDYFSETGQLWGNPLYRWEVMAENGFQWWIDRIRSTLNMVDIIRIDHFRGFEAYWEIPASEETAINGEWIKAPGTALFNAVKEALGVLPILAEDLGVITKEVEALRDEFSFPGMKVLQFAFDAKEAGNLNATNLFLPHNYGRNFVVYTGTHDNDTTTSWYRERSDEEKDLIRRYLGRPDDDIAWDFIRLALASVAKMAVFPLQDLFSLGPEARMNTPSVLGGNWSWRYQTHQLNEFTAIRLRDLTTLYGRDPQAWKEAEEAAAKTEAEAEE
ncbi:MAG: 4-alpha-glucanotransferase [Anaerolineaceae bacterium]|nr:4-alpha-glucanotransferase [Anaerolineaceae bacterium]MCB9098689.1 4-alpha-glucanotransferase [Anaerolineales bacterium]